MRKLLAIFFLLLSSLAYTQCVTDLNFNEGWVQRGYDEAEWEVVSDSVVNQMKDTYLPSFFISQEDYLYVKISGTFYVTAADADNDFIGFVVGYKRPANNQDQNYKFILFDWKSGANETIDLEPWGTLTGYTGFTLSEVNTDVLENQWWYYFWGHNEEAGKFKKLDSDYGLNKGWVKNTEYNFTVSYTSKRVIVSINDEEIFDVEGEFEPGKFGFYCFSQRNVFFKNFDYELEYDFTLDKEEICAGESVKFEMIPGSNPQMPDNIESFNWYFDDGSTSQVINPEHSFTEPGTYDIKLIVRDFNNCTDTTIRKLTVHAFPEVQLPADTTIEYLDSIRLDADAPGAMFQWTNGSHLPSAVLYQLRTDTLLGVYIEKNGCATYAETYIHVNPPITPDAFLPNAFSPNGDGLNDTFLPVLKNITDYELHIYDRWGTHLFASENQGGWDGTYKGRHCPRGTYVYIFQYSGFDYGEERVSEKLQGVVSLLR